MTFELSDPAATLRTRPLGFDKDEVRACLRNLISDYDEAMRQIERLTVELQAASDVRRKPVPTETAGVQVEKILASAHRVAEDVKTDAENAARQLLREAQEEAAQVRSRAEADATALTRSATARVAELERDIQHLIERRQAVEALLDETADRLSAIAQDIKRTSPSTAPVEHTVFNLPKDHDSSWSRL
jgi:cell division septum initiation protein DivIVA